MSGMKKTEAQRKAIVTMRRAYGKGTLDLTQPQHKDDLKKSALNDLERARKRLEEMIASNDEEGIKRVQEIIKNVTQTLNRMK